MNAEQIIAEVVDHQCGAEWAELIAEHVARALRAHGIDLDHTYEVVDREDRNALWKAVIAVEHSLTSPYPDDTRWSPWTRFVKPALDRSRFLTSPVFVRRRLGEDQ